MSDREFRRGQDFVSRGPQIGSNGEHPKAIESSDEMWIAGREGPVGSYTELPTWSEIPVVCWNIRQGDFCTEKDRI